jgi:MerR family transcriptional regulator, thiopeptide resistance regulator
VPFEALKVGELARRTGLTIRTLHHYDELGLLKPSGHTESGHRLYTASDAVRLQQVLSLRQLGFSLEEVGKCLDQPEFAPLEVIRLHIERLRSQLELQQGLCARLEGLAAYFSEAGKVSADDFLQTIEVMIMIANYYTPEQLESFRKRHEADPEGTEKLARQGQADWAELMAEYKGAMEQGVDPADPRAQALEKRRRALVSAFTGGDAGIEQSLTKLWKEQGDKLCAQFGYDPKVLEYLDKVVEAAKKST